ncbi:DUF3667 domain-containing protein [Aquimarina sp. D1M17]|uniref:DUF3667 domain-containing protein n=1 Tax=Aquimarina acroporae TaxID=2937283 RepID=UPI0020C1170A|nr:DUF3667 domain-containing protein [Aquimarina acroporae]MCK8522173.1 DUF3667 domain-containing protein [Aquimarina acroporae]
MKDKGRFLKKYRGNECLNCGVPLDIIDRYCHNCGQANTTKKLSFKDFFNEFFASIFSYDSRLRHTIIALLFSPGKISKEYIHGKRVKYANPFRFYLSVSIIFFIINGLFIDFDKFSSDIGKDAKMGKEALSEIEKSINVDDSIKEKISTQISETQGIPESEKETIKNAILSTDSIQLSSLLKKKQKEVSYYTQSQIDSMGFFSRPFKLWKMYDDYYDKTKETSTFKALADLKHEETRLNKYLYKRVKKTNNISDNYGIDLWKFIFNQLPFIIFFFLPFFALAMWFIYIRRTFTYMEHLVFIFHTQTMFFILIGISILIGQIIHSSIIGITLLVFLFYLYKAMRKFYNQGRFKTIVKFLLVNVLFFILASIGSAITLVGSIFIF